MNKVTEKMLILVAEELNETLGLSPGIETDLSKEDLQLDIMDAAGELLETDEISKASKRTLLAIGAILPEAWGEKALDEPEQEPEPEKKTEKKSKKEPEKKPKKKKIKKTIKEKEPVIKEVKEENDPEPETETKEEYDPAPETDVKKEEVKKVDMTDQATGISKKELLSILDQVKPALSSKGLFPCAPYFLFKKGMVSASNGDITITQSAPNLSIEGAVIANEFYNLISKINDDYIQIAMNKKGNIIVNGKILKATIKVNSEITSDDIQIPEDEAEWKPLPEGFSNDLNICLFEPRASAMFPSLNYIFVIKGLMLFCDRFAGAQKTMSEKIDDELSIPFNSAKKLAKYKVNKYFISHSQIYFKSDFGLIFSYRQIDPVFCSTEEQDLFIEEEDSVSVNVTESLINLLSGVSTTELNTDVMNRSISLSSNNDNKIICKGEGKWGTVVGKIEIEDSVQFDVKVNPDFLPKSIKFNTITISDRLLFKGDKIKFVTFLIS